MNEDLQASSLFNANGLVAVITGGGSGLGRTMALALATNGAKAVYVVGRRKEALEETASQGPSGVIVPMQGDVTSKDSLAAMAERVKADMGHVDVLIANSGIVGPSVRTLLPTDRRPTLQEFKDAMWAPSMDEFSQASHVNCTAAFYTALAFLELLDAGNAKANVAQKSQIVVTASIAGLSRKIAGGFAYSASKAAALHLAKCLGTYLLPWHIRVNAIAPGLYPSEMTENSMPKTDRQPWEEGAVEAERVPLTRVGAPQDMAGAILYLVSSAGGYVNGEILITDGGRLSMGLR